MTIPPLVKAFFSVGLIITTIFAIWLALKLAGLVGEPDRGVGF
jgi:hypothetical protein